MNNLGILSFICYNIQYPSCARCPSCGYNSLCHAFIHVTMFQISELYKLKFKSKIIIVNPFLSDEKKTNALENIQQKYTELIKCNLKFITSIKHTVM